MCRGGKGRGVQNGNNDILVSVLCPCSLPLHACSQADDPVCKVSNDLTQHDYTHLHKSVQGHDCTGY